jgi:sterol 3beta-glucosyltransferase
MRVTFVAIGTRGDVQPIVALARAMSQRDHEVTVVAGSNFGRWIESHGLGFVPTVDMDRLMSGDEGVGWARRSHDPLAQLRSMKSILDSSLPSMISPLIEAAEGADLLVSGTMSEPFVQAIATAFGTRHVHAGLQPTRISRDPAANLSPLVTSRISRLNAVGGRVGQVLLWRVARDSLQRLRTRLRLPGMSMREHLRVVSRTPAIFGYSPLVAARPADWSRHCVVTGYWFLEDQEQWSPPKDLEDFLASGAAPVYIGFGSMPDVDPGHTTSIISDAVRAVGMRAIVASPANGPAGDIFPVHDIPHSWLFPRVSAVVHHGGAGTTAAGLRAGRPTLAIPHMADQFFWARRCHEIGVGVRPVPRHELTTAGLVEGLKALLSDPSTSKAAAALGSRIALEDGLDAAVTFLEAAGDG